MSGGTIDYSYHGLQSIADQLGDILKASQTFDKSKNDSYLISPAGLNGIASIQIQAAKLQFLLRALDLFLSGDTGEGSFHEAFNLVDQVKIVNT